MTRTFGGLRAEVLGDPLGWGYTGMEAPTVFALLRGKEL